MIPTAGSSTDVRYDIPSHYEIIIILLICLSYTLATLLIARYCTSISNIGSNVPWFHPSSVAALIGLLIGGIMSSFNVTIVFSDNIFLYLVLPPIIFTAGYTLKKKKFFTYLQQIVLYGLLGSVVNFIFITFAAYYYQRITLSWNQALLLASVLAANDEISAISLIKQSEFPRLGALLFGEGVLNDALSIVLFQALLSFSRKSAQSKNDSKENMINLAVPLILSVLYQLSISCIIGLSCGLCNARVLKVFTFSRKYPVHQTTLIMLTGYLAYTIAEAMGVSSILTLFVSAVTMSHYSWHSLSKSAKLASRITFVSMSDAAEGFAFAYVGLSLWVVVKGPINMTFSFYMLAVVILARFVTILSLALLNDLFMGRIKVDLSYGYWIKYTADVPFVELVAFSLGGVVRGCLCWAQVLQIGSVVESQVLVQTTVVIILATTIGCGFLLPLTIPRLTMMIKDTKTAGIKGSNRHSSPIRHSEREDEDGSTYSMHLEGSVNESDEEIEHAALITTPQTSTSAMKTDRSGATSKETSSILYGESKVEYHSFDERDSTTIQYRPLTNQALADRDKSSSSLRSRKLHRYSLLFILWIRIDEQYLKPTFGGSALAKKKAKSKALSMTKTLKVYEMLSPVRMVTVESDIDNDEDGDAEQDDKIDDDDEYEKLEQPNDTSTGRLASDARVIVNFQDTFNDMSLFPRSERDVEDGSNSATRPYTIQKASIE